MSSAQSGREKRYFPRVDYRTHATLMTTKKRYEVTILDLAFNGALAALIHKHTLKDGEELILTIDVDDGENIKMQGKLAHQKEHFLGIECRAAGIDNQARLRMLLEKHKVDDEQAERSIEDMVKDHQNQ